MNKKFTYVKKLEGSGKENIGLGPGVNVYEGCLLLSF